MGCPRTTLNTRKENNFWRTPKTRTGPFIGELFELCNCFSFRVVGVVRGPIFLLSRIRGRARFHSSPDGPAVHPRERGRLVESRWGDDRLVALAELPFCYPEPGAGVGSTEFRPTAVTIRGRARFHSSPDGPAVHPREWGRLVESRWGDDRLVALAELPLCYPEPGAGVGSTEFRPTAVTIRGRARFHSSPDGPAVHPRERGRLVESRWGDDRLVALAELPFCYPEPGAGVGSTEFRPTAVTR
jgi:hypothetical protein